MGWHFGMQCICYYTLVTFYQEENCLCTLGNFFYYFITILLNCRKCHKCLVLCTYCVYLLKILSWYIISYLKVSIFKKYALNNCKIINKLTITGLPLKKVCNPRFLEVFLHGLYSYLKFTPVKIKQTKYNTVIFPSNRI